MFIADTAGRMHTKQSLVVELKKIDRIVQTKAGNAVSYKKFLVLDATTGRNAVVQAETFHEAVRLDGIIFTKFDSSARGGAIFSLVPALKIPVVFVCDGEKYENIRAFSPERYVRDFLQMDDGGAESAPVSGGAGKP
jgi:fused signal recognition particle receptor